MIVPKVLAPPGRRSPVPSITLGMLVLLPSCTALWVIFIYCSCLNLTRTFKADVEPRSHVKIKQGNLFILHLGEGHFYRSKLAVGHDGLLWFGVTSITSSDLDSAYAGKLPICSPTEYYVPVKASRSDLSIAWKAFPRNLTWIYHSAVRSQ